jgi:hypothetical protein
MPDHHMCKRTGHIRAADFRQGSLRHPSPQVSGIPGDQSPTYDSQCSTSHSVSGATGPIGRRPNG